MFLRNYYAALANVLTTTRTTYKNLNGAVQTAYDLRYGGDNSYYYGQYQAMKLASTSFTTLYVGTGTTAPTLGDYAMESDVTSSLTSTPLQVNFGAFEDDFSISGTVSQVFVNNGSSDVIVSEVGLSHKYDNASPTHDFLYYRDTFTPVTVAPGKALTVTISMTFDGFSALANTQVGVA